MRVDLALATSRLPQKLLQLFILLLEFPNEFVLCTLVNHSLVLDLLRSVRVSERRQGLLEVHVRGRNGADHDGLGVATEGVLQNTGQTGVSVRHNLLLGLAHCLVGEYTDASTKRRQALVDSATFLQSLTRCSSLAGLLGTSQVNEIDDGELFSLPSIFLDLDLLEFDGDDRVGTT